VEQQDGKNQQQDFWNHAHDWKKGEQEFWELLHDCLIPATDYTNFHGSFLVCTTL
jgi:hypothetical protein